MVQYFGGDAVTYNGAELSGEVSKFLCQRLGGVLPPASQVSEWLQTGQIPESGSTEG